MGKWIYGFRIGIVIVLVSAVCFSIYLWDYANSSTHPLYSTPAVFPSNKTLILPHGLGFQGTCDKLAEQGVIDQPSLCKLWVVLTGSAKRFKAGEYSFPSISTPQQVIDMIVRGQVVIHKITIPEGLTVHDIISIFASEPALEGDIPKGIAEGSLMPETYHFIRGEKRQDVIARMQAAMKSTLDALWQKRKAGLPFTTPEQALTLASIVEKETGLVAERGHVASVFLNRLKLGMKLQSDPTVVYGIEQKTGVPMGRALTSADLQTDTSYNTYVIAGLPPAPIANPGRAAIEAVLNPPDTNDLYFVATGSGGHNFSSTLEQHNRNVQLYRAKMAK